MHDSMANRISVITVNLNNRTGLEKTIRSVISQENVSVELIVIDGGSEDGSKEIIRKNSLYIAASVSEPDNGPYDAMNKGIGFSTGEWIIFLNSGDVFFSPDTLSGIFKHQKQDIIDAFYGDSLADYGDFQVYRKAGLFEELWKGMIFSHQALLMCASLLKKERFDTRYTRIADYDLVLRCLTDAERVTYIPTPLVICDAFGISNKGQASILWEYYRRASKSLRIGFVRKLYYFRMFIFLSLIDLLKKILPERLFNLMIRLFRKNVLSQKNIGPG
jgi:glycosyltransferase involved in cell wall biosynthesis